MLSTGGVNIIDYIVEGVGSYSVYGRLISYSSSVKGRGAGAV